MSYELTGTLIEIFDEQQISDRFKKREFVVETVENNFTDVVKFQLVQDKTNLIDGFQKGNKIKVSFNIRGNKWKDNYFVNLQAWKIENVGESTSTPTDNPPPLTDEDLPPLPDAPDDDLPF
jgi:hypothetical protein